MIVMGHVTSAPKQDTRYQSKTIQLGNLCHTTLKLTGSYLLNQVKCLSQTIHLNELLV